MEDSLFKGLDPITMEVVGHKLDGIANEMELTLLRSSFSPTVKEAKDASASLFTSSGETLAQACAIPVHLGTLVPCVEAVLRVHPVGEMQEGDIYVMNDPYLGGTHLPDFAVVMPVFCDGKVMALTATMTHHQDVGGMTPGSIPTNATEIFQEGIRIPVLKLRDAGGLNHVLIDILKLNVRMPDVFMGDLNAQIAACTIGARRVIELAETYSSDQVTRIFEGLLDRSELLTRKELLSLPEGSYNYVGYLDNDGVDLDKRIRIEVTTIVKGGCLHFDFTGTSPQVRGPFNCVPSGARAAAYYAVRALTSSEIPTNGGCFRPITLHLPKGSLFNPECPAAVNSRTQTIKVASACMVGAFAEVLPDKVPASNAVDQHVITWAGKRTNGSTFVVAIPLVGGSGAGAHADGVNAIDTDMTNCMNLPVEALEMDSPIRVHRVELRNDSGGAGIHRGGLGVLREYEMLADAITMTHRGERSFTAPLGSRGGGAGAMSHSVVRRKDGTEWVVPSKAVDVLNNGDRLIVETAGGGGHGDPRMRTSENVREDLLNETVSNALAREVYGRTPA